MIPNILPFRGSVLLTGAPSQYQQFVARDLAGSVALAGGVVAFLVDADRDTVAIAEYALAWRFARHVPDGSRLQLIGIGGLELMNDPVKVATRLYDTGRSKPTLLVRDLSTNMAALNAGDPWASLAQELSRVLDCVVLTVGHAGHAPIIELDGLAAEFDEIWTCATYHDKERQSSLNVRLQRFKPASSDKIELHGSEIGRLILFDDAKAFEEKAHA